MWIAQDKCGRICKYYDTKPKYGVCENWINGHKWEILEEGKHNNNWKNLLINLETYDYKIEDGILIKVDKKPELEKLIARIAKIDPVAAKWLNDNKHTKKLNDNGDAPYNRADLYQVFEWVLAPQGSDFWRGIADKLEANEDKEDSNRHKDADALIEHANDQSLTLQFKHVRHKHWRDSSCGHDYEYRIKPKPKTKVVRFRVFVDNKGVPIISTEERPDINAVWIGDWQEVEIEENE